MSWTFVTQTYIHFNVTVLRRPRFEIHRFFFAVQSCPTGQMRCAERTESSILMHADVWQQIADRAPLFYEDHIRRRDHFFHNPTLNFNDNGPTSIRRGRSFFPACAAAPQRPASERNIQFMGTTALLTYVPFMDSIRSFFLNSQLDSAYCWAYDRSSSATDLRL